MNYFSSIKPKKELLQNLNGKECPYFARHHQQNYLKAKIHELKNSNYGAPLIDFTSNELIALFFANFELDWLC